MVIKLKDQNLLELYENTLYADIRIESNAQHYELDELILFIYMIKNDFLISKITAILMKRIIDPKI